MAQTWLLASQMALISNVSFLIIAPSLPPLLLTHLTYKGGDADVLSIVDPHDRRDDLIDEALRHAQLQQRIR